MRAGESPQQVSAETGWPIDRVERYAEQPLAERAFIADRALSVEIRRSGSPVSVRDTAVEVLARSGLDLSDLAVDSARRADGKWTIRAEIPGRSVSATWVYDHAGRSLQPLDDGARRLMGVEPESAQSPAQAPAPDVAESRPRLVAVPDATVDEPDTDTQVVAEVSPGELDASAEPASSPSANQETLALPLHTTPPTTERPAAAAKSKPRAKGRRASVPSWDEILFGTSTHDGD